MTDDNSIDQDEIERLLEQVRETAAPPKKPATSEASPTGGAAGPPRTSPLPTDVTPAASAASASRGRPSRSTSDDIDFLLRQTEEAISSIDAPVESSLTGAHAFQFEDLTGTPPSTDYATLDLLRDVELDLTIELGRTEMFLEDVLRLKRGTVVALDKMAGEPVDVYVNGRLIARGEVLVLNENFCVRIAELVTGDDLD